MTKYFCDECREELKSTDHVRIKIESKIGLCIEVITGLMGDWNSGHFHHKCIIRKLNYVFEKREERGE